MTDTGLEIGKWLGGAAAGALLMYMLDPDRGGARRAQSGERLRDMGRQTGNALGNVWHDVSGRLGAGTPEERPDSGAAGHMMDAMERGGDWAPALRSSAVLGGGILGLYGLLRRSPLGLALGLTGVALLTRGASNQPLTDLLRHPRVIDLESSIQIDASPDEVYDMWTNYENFPRFMSNVSEVRDLGQRRSHWVVRGPAGARFAFNAILTERVRPQRLAWRTEPGAEVEQSGSVEFEPWRGGTRVTVRISYAPPAGTLGQGVAMLLGSNPKRQLKDDLARMKALIERGVKPRDLAAQGRPGHRFLH